MHQYSVINPSHFACLLQVLLGDIRPAIETHELLYQVIQKHKFLPEVSLLTGIGSLEGFTALR